MIVFSVWNLFLSSQVLTTFYVYVYMHMCSEATERPSAAQLLSDFSFCQVKKLTSGNDSVGQ